MKSKITIILEGWSQPDSRHIPLVASVNHIRLIQSSVTNRSTVSLTRCIRNLGLPAESLQKFPKHSSAARRTKTLVVNPLKVGPAPGKVSIRAILLITPNLCLTSEVDCFLRFFREVIVSQKLLLVRGVESWRVLIFYKGPITTSEGAALRKWCFHRFVLDESAMSI